MKSPSFAGTVFFSNGQGIMYQFRPDFSWEVFVRGRGFTWIHELVPGDVIDDPQTAKEWGISHNSTSGLVVDRIVADDVAAVLES